MKLTQKIAGAAIAATLAIGASSAASAAVLVIPFSSAPSPSGGGSFTDVFTFTFPSAGKASISINSSITGPLTNVNFLNKGVTFNGTALTVVSKGAVELLQLINQPVAAGLQTLTIKGSAQKLGSYTGTINFASVPEPATWAMMILGLGAVGYSMRRRTAKVAFAA
jgi:hypothetical protein